MKSASATVAAGVRVTRLQGGGAEDAFQSFVSSLTLQSDEKHSPLTSYFALDDELSL